MINDQINPTPMHATSTFQALISADGSSPKSNCEREPDQIEGTQTPVIRF